MLSSTRQAPTTAMALAEHQLGRSLRDALLTEFAALSSAEICERLGGISARTLDRWMERLGLERRSVIVAIQHENDATPAEPGRAENIDGPDPRPLPGEVVGVEANGG